MNATEPFEQLKELNPAPTRGDMPEVDAAHAEAILQRVLVLADRHRRRTRRTVIAAVTAGALASAAATWIVTRPAEDATAVSCFERAGLDGPRVGLPGRADPIDACEQVWSSGEFGEADHAPLYACVLDNGTVGVFPGDQGEPCSALGLDVADSSGAADPIVGVQERLPERLGERCVPIDEGFAIAQAELDEAGLDDWQVEAPAARPPDRPCASPAFDAGRRAIVIVPIPDVRPND